MGMKWNDLAEEACPVARAMSVVGDRWTLLILRDCLFGITRFDVIQARLGITRHVLSDRLKKLETAGLLKRVAYQERPPRYDYRPTQAAKDFVPVLVTMIDWANAHIPSDKPDPYRMLTRDTRTPVRTRVVDVDTGAEIAANSIWVESTRD